MDTQTSIEEEGSEVPVPLLAQLITGRYTEDRIKKLEHEQGIGAPCSRCGSGCAGLDLHFWRKICKNCGCKYDDHEVKVNKMIHQIIVSNLFEANDGTITLGLDLDPEDKIIEEENNNVFIAGSPVSDENGLTNNVKRPFQRSSPSSSSMSPGTMPPLPPPRKQSFDDVRRQQLLLKQLPPQDFDPQYCHNLTREEQRSMNDLEKQMKSAAGKGRVERNVTAIDWVCEECGKGIVYGQNAIFTEHSGPTTCWHPNCFKCNVCKDRIIDNIYFSNDGKIHCGRHFAEIYKPRCAACDELIFQPECTRAEGKNWHRKHFVCFTCENHLGGCSYVAHKEQPYCMTCYHFKVASKCSSCLLPIEVGAERIKFEKQTWHASPECFFCHSCGNSLSDVPFLPKDGKVYCSSKCTQHY